MFNLDTLKEKRNEIMQRMSTAIQKGDNEEYASAFNDFCANLEERVRADALELSNINDVTILAQRGYRQLTSVENKFYESFIEASKSNDIKQSLTDIKMPETIFDNVFEDLVQNHPLLTEIDFMNTTGLTRIFTSKNGEQKAIWGKLTAKIVQELFASFEENDMTLMKLSAFIPVSKDMLDLGPQFIDKYVRNILSESIANGLEEAIVCGDGKEKIIGMDRYVGDDVTVTAGAYPEKPAIKVNDFKPVTIGNVVSLIAVDPSGKPRKVSNLILLVNPQDYYRKVMPATTIMAPDGTYRNDVMPVPMKIIQTTALQKGKAILGMSKKMFVGVGMSKDGNIEYSDEYQFLEDNRVYKDKVYSNGFPKDNNAFQVLDINGLEPLSLVVETKNPVAPSNDATLSNLTLGNVALYPVFNATTKDYTAETKNVTNTVTATPIDALSDIKITVNGKEITNGSSTTWEDGNNTVKVEVSNGTGKETYSIAVKKVAE